MFVTRFDGSRLTTLAADRRLKLKGPVVVSEATLEPSAAAAQAGIVFGPLSAARVNKQAAAEEQAELMAVLACKDAELGACQGQIEVLRALIDHLRDLHSTYAEERPDAALRRPEILRGEKGQVDQRARNALTRQQDISKERAQFRARLRDLGDAINELKMAKQAIEQFARRYAEVAAMAARIPVADAERQREEEAARTARAAAAKARSAADQNRVDAVRLRAAAEARRSEKAHYPETDGGAADRIATLEDLRDQYKTLEHTLASKRDAQQATISLELTRVKSAIFTLHNDYTAACRDVTEPDMAPFAAIADLARAISEAELSEQQKQRAVTQVEAAELSAQSALGPVSGKIDRAFNKTGLRPIPVPEFAQAPADLCTSEAARREQQAEKLDSDIRILARECEALRTRLNDVKTRLAHIVALAKRADGHLPGSSRSELADLSVAFEELERTVDQVLDRIGEAVTAISELEQQAEARFEGVRQLVDGENFRRLEPTNIRSVGRCQIVL